MNYGLFKQALKELSCPFEHYYYTDTLFKEVFTKWTLHKEQQDFILKVCRLFRSSSQGERFNSFYEIYKEIDSLDIKPASGRQMVLAMVLDFLWTHSLENLQVFDHALKFPWKLKSCRKQVELSLLKIGQFKFERSHVKSDSKENHEKLQWNEIQSLEDFWTQVLRKYPVEKVTPITQDKHVRPLLFQGKAGSFYAQSSGLLTKEVKELIFQFDQVLYAPRPHLPHKTFKDALVDYVNKSDTRVFFSTAGVGKYESVVKPSWSPQNSHVVGRRYYFNVDNKDFAFFKQEYEKEENSRKKLSFLFFALKHTSGSTEWERFVSLEVINVPADYRVGTKLVESFWNFLDIGTKAVLTKVCQQSLTPVQGTPQGAFFSSEKDKIETLVNYPETLPDSYVKVVLEHLKDLRRLRPHATYKYEKPLNTLLKRCEQSANTKVKLHGIFAKSKKSC